MSFTIDTAKRELMNQKIERKTLCRMQHRVILFLFLLFFWDPCSSNVGAFDIVPEVSETVLSSSHSFYFFCTSEVISTILSSSSLIHSFASDILLLIPSRVFLIPVIVLFVSVCLSLILLGLC